MPGSSDARVCSCVLKMRERRGKGRVPVRGLCRLFEALSAPAASAGGCVGAMQAGAIGFVGARLVCSRARREAQASSCEDGFVAAFRASRERAPEARHNPENPMRKHGENRKKENRSLGEAAQFFFPAPAT